MTVIGTYFNSYEIKGNQITLNRSIFIPFSSRKTIYLPRTSIIALEDGREFNVSRFVLALIAILFSSLEYHDQEIRSTIITAAVCIMVDVFYKYFTTNVSIHTASSTYHLRCCTGDVAPLISWFTAGSTLTDVLIDSEHH